MKATPIDQELALISTLAWSKTDAIQQAAMVVSLLPGAVTSWDEGDEDWIQVMDGAATICYIHVRRPFIMLLGKFSETLYRVIEARVVVLVVDSWTERAFSADLAGLRKAFPGYILPDALPGRSVEAFSAEDLWFATD
ncbi:hypothetical protein [Micromonospora sp. CB01531]|uniref:hypothetical protein n=1 Tax=Micromonospora sp. CB01531 TaxID=1718947 RepID=UPI001160E4D5|nr:hypothetical protein [Micromonospora sp. CB01531]